MAERWICDRCRNRNEGVNYTCQRCGEAKGWGSVPVETPQGPIPGPASPRRPQSTPRGRPGWLRFIWVPVVLAFIFAPLLGNSLRDRDGVIVRAGSMSVHELRVGDCFNIPDEPSPDIETVEGIPCSDPHDFEVLVVRELEPGPFPSDLDFDIHFETTCLSAFQPYVGTPYPVSEIWLDMIVPLPEGWSQGDRTITCLLFDPEDQVTGSLKSSNR